jgi:hypothetical protein
MALADFAASEGIALEPKQGTDSSETPPQQGTMGPVSQ